MKRRVLLLTCLALAACPRRVPGPTEVLDDAAARAQAGGASARELALAGFHALAVQGDVELARTRFDQSLALDPAEPWALHGQGWVAWWHGHPERALQAAAALCLKAPRHPLAAVAARTLFESAGQSRQGDDQILEVSAQALAAGARGDVAWLLRAARAAIFANRQSPERAQAVAELGSPTEALLVGPLSPWHVLDALERLPPEEKGQLDGVPGARTLRFADAHLSLTGESGSGDGYLFGSDVTVAQEGDYLLRSVSQLDHAVVLDGAPVLQRSTWKLPASSQAVRGVHLTAGVHRLVVRAFKGGLQGHVWVSLQPADGQAPRLTFAAAKGPPPARWGPAPTPADDEPSTVPGSYPTAQSLAEALEPEGGAALAALVAAADARGRDRDGVKTLLDALPPSVAAPAVLVARAEVALEDRALPARVSRGRATRDLEQALEKDPHSVPALLAQATLAFEDARYADAMELAARARAAHTPAGAPVALLEARVAQALNLDGRAEQAVAATLTAHAGDCEALALQADVARRHDALELERHRQEALAGCPGAQ
ncbi:MAG: hypothetical protein K1X89_28980, partial [Myxococcaceae bacterium]|nr:hypothetical protein [Myxococcaceae bacterium]